MAGRREEGPLLQTVERAFEVLDQLLTRKDEAMTVAEIAQALMLNRTTTWRLVLTLKALGYLEQLEGHRFRLGLKLYYFGSLIQNRFDVRQLADPVMERLRKESTESVYLWLGVERSRVCIHALESSRPIRHQIAVGEILPLHAGAAGKLLLAHKPAVELAEYLEGPVPEPFDADTLSRTDELEHELQKICAQGYAVSRGERFSESFSVAAPIRDHAGAVVAALSIAGPAARMVADEGRYVRLACAAANEISRLMGYHDLTNQTG